MKCRGLPPAALEPTGAVGYAPGGPEGAVESCLCHINRRMHPAASWNQAGKSGSDLTEMRAIKHTMELIAHSLYIANGALAKVAREGWPGRTALLNGPVYGTPSLNCTKARSLLMPIGRS